MWRRCRLHRCPHHSAWWCLPLWTPTSRFCQGCHSPPARRRAHIKNSIKVSCDAGVLRRNKTVDPIAVKFFFQNLSPTVNKPIYHSMDNLNSSSAFQYSTSTGRFPTLPFSRGTFAPNSTTSLSGHLMVPGSPLGSAAQTASPNSRVVPMITRSQSSNNLPENVTENLYDEVGGGLSSRINYRVPKKSCSQWDMVGASGRKNHLEVGNRKTYKPHPAGYTHILWVALLFKLLLFSHYMYRKSAHKRKCPGLRGWIFSSSSLESLIRERTKAKPHL